MINKNFIKALEIAPEDYDVLVNDYGVVRDIKLTIDNVNKIVVIDSKDN